MYIFSDLFSFSALILKIGLDLVFMASILRFWHWPQSRGFGLGLSNLSYFNIND